MDSREAMRNMRKDLAEIEKVLAWLERSNETQQIDKDVLLNRTRNLYNQFLNLPVGPFELPSEPPAEEAKPLRQSNPQAAPPSQSQHPGQPPHPPKQPEQPQPTRPVPEPEWEPESEPEQFQATIHRPKHDSKPEVKYEQKPVPKPEPRYEPKPEPETKPDLKQEPRPEHRPEPKPEPKPDYFDLPYHPPTPRTQKPPVRKTDSDNNPLLREGRLNEALGRKNPVHDLASSIVEIPVADIWSAITINERFLFIRELFGNDPDSFKSTVTFLNSLDSWESAKELMANRFDWDKNNPVAANFLNIVRRRFLR